MDNDTGKPDVSQIEPDSRGVYQGNGWMYNKNSDALTLKSGKYDFNYTFPGFSDSKHYDDCDHLNCVNVNHIVVQPDATIVGGNFWEQSLSNYGTVTNGLFKGTSVTNHGTLNCLFPPNPDNSKPTGIGTIECHSLTAADNSTVEVLLYSSTFGNTTTTYSEGTFYFTGTPTLEVKLSSNEEITCINGEKLYGGLTKPDWKGYQTFTPKAGEDIVLNQEPYVPNLAISNGIPDLSRADDQPSEFVFQGKGWKYEIDSHTLTLERGEYNFSKDGLGPLGPDEKLVVGPGATLTGGVFNEIPDGLPADNFQTIILNGSGLNGSGSIEAVNGLSSPKWSKKLYAIKGSQVEIKANVPLTDINCRVIDPHYYPDSRDKTTLLFTINGDFIYSYTKLGETELTLNKSTRTNLIMLDNGCPNLEGVPYNWDGMYTYTGDGWKYVFNNSGSLELNDTSSYNFRYLDPLNEPGSELAAVTCGIINSGATIEDGVFKNLVINHSGIISGGTFAVGLFSIDSEDFSTSGTVTGGAFNGKDGLSDGYHAVTVNGGSIRKVNDTEPLVLDSSHNLTTGTKWNLYSYEGTIVTVTADTDITNINGWDIGKFPGGSNYPNGEDDKTTVRFRMPDGPVVLNDTLYTLDIIRGTMLGNTSVSAPAGTELILDADEPAKNETFLGWTLSDKSLLTKGTLNDPECTRITIKMKNASATAEAVFQKDTPAYTLTVTGGGLVNRKTSAVVEAGDEVRLTVGEMQDGMSFNYWDLPTPLLKALTDEDSTFSNKVESLTFTMPDLSKYTEDTSLTIRLDIRPAELPDDDDGPAVLGTMATVAVGGAAAGILVWQGVSLGVDSYLQLSLPDGVPVPANRIELVKLLWETAGKPDVVLPALYGDVSTEDAELQKATRWAIDNGLVKPADDSDASRFDPDRSVSKYEVARAWFKVQQMLK